MKPTDVTARNEKDLLQRVYKKFKVKATLKRPKFKVGDRVRISKFKHIFEKGYTPNWTPEIFTVSRVKNTDPVTYNLKDYQDHTIESGFYEHEHTSVEYPDIYLMEKILRKRGNKLFVKWLGFDGSHNSWIDKSDLWTSPRWDKEKQR
ncbi:uncharacterized protein LOC107267236 [Cephus cinctus]|uniref:Uncharacterized protein LOC107267236 n=1 Tax=Cephus cinctus TaxID=211228 RepID=A0AAJ7BUP0_CEPCN|nr:uncharacterized protein LOC107267236 [Cephus cinctus]